MRAGLVEGSRRRRPGHPLRIGSFRSPMTSNPEAASGTPQGSTPLGSDNEPASDWMSSQAKRRKLTMYERILVPVDGSEASMLGLNEAVKLAKSLGGQLRLAHVVNEFVMNYSPGAVLSGIDVVESIRNDGKNILQRAEAYARQQGAETQCVLLETIGRPAADAILAYAREWPADLIVMGTHGRRGLRRFALGSDAEDVVRRASSPVLLVRDHAPDSSSPLR